MGDANHVHEFNGLTQAEATLPSHFYFDPDHHKRELDALWYRQWLYVCRSDQVVEPGHWRTFRIGTQSILIVRDTDNKLRAFQNTCRHRGSILCEGSGGQFRNGLITCPYHQWAYALDGRLVSTTSHSEATNFDKEDYPLHKAAVHEWRGNVFVCPAGASNAGSFEESFARNVDSLTNWPLENLALAHSWSKSIECNWKVFWENFNECLHCPNIHPELSELVPLYGRRIIDPKDVPDWQETANIDDPRYQGGLRDGAATWTSDGQVKAMPFEGLTDTERARGQTYVVCLPSVFIVGHTDYVRIVRVMPLGPERTELQSEWLVRPETLARADFDVKDITEFPTLVLEQDAAACELNQRGLHAMGYHQGVLMPEEYYLHQFHNWVRERLRTAVT